MIDNHSSNCHYMSPVRWWFERSLYSQLVDIGCQCDQRKPIHLLPFRRHIDPNRFRYEYNIFIQKLDQTRFFRVFMVFLYDFFFGFCSKIDRIRDFQAYLMWKLIKKTRFSFKNSRGRRMHKFSISKKSFFKEIRVFSTLFTWRILMGVWASFWFWPNNSYTYSG